jgi:hypothetical protein
MFVLSVVILSYWYISCASYAIIYIDMYRGVAKFSPMAQRVVHALSKVWLAARVSLRLARLPRSRCLRSTRAAAPVLLAHDEVTKTGIFV